MKIALKINTEISKYAICTFSLAMNTKLPLPQCLNILITQTEYLCFFFAMDAM